MHVLFTESRQNARGIGFKLIFKGAELQYNNVDWKKSIVLGQMKIENSNHNVSYNLVSTLQGVYKMH